MRGVVAVVLAGALAACGRANFDLLRDSTGDGGAGDDASVDAFAGPELNAGTTAFAARFGGTGNEEGYDLAIAPDGSVVVTGTLTGTVSFGSQMLLGAGGEDIFVASFDADGTPRWAKSYGSAGTDRSQAVVVGGDGRIYVAGLFSGTVNFGGGQSRTAAGTLDWFLLALDPTGATRWVVTKGGATNAFAYDLALDAAGNPLVTGYYTGAADFGQGPLPAVLDFELFIAKYDAQGVMQWARGYASSGPDSGQGIAATPAGNVIATGRMGGALDFGGGPIGASGGSFLVELTAAGAYVGARADVGTYAWDVVVDPRDSRILVGSRVSGAADLGNGPLPAPVGGDDGLVVAFDRDRNLLWHREQVGALSDLGLGIAVDERGNSYSIGLGGPDMEFGAGPVTGSGGQDIYVVSHDPSGALRWARQFGGAVQDRGYSVAVAPGGAVYLTGRYAGTADFGTGPMTSAGGDDMFLVKLD